MARTMAQKLKVKSRKNLKGKKDFIYNHLFSYFTSFTMFYIKDLSSLILNVKGISLQIFLELHYQNTGPLGKDLDDINI